MILVLGLGRVGKAILEYSILNFNKNEVCFFDEHVQNYYDFPFFSSWNDIHLVITSPGFSLDHYMIKEAIKKNIPITNDIGIFLNKEKLGFKIGVTGTNGKSTLCAMLNYILPNSIIGGNFGTSPINFYGYDFYIIEISSYQMETLSDDDLSQLDVGVITNITKHHLKRHASFEVYKNLKEKIKAAKFFIYAPDLNFENIKFPENDLFANVEYQYAWAVVIQIFKYFNLDISFALEKIKNFKRLQYRQEIIFNNPVIINDSKATNEAAQMQAINNMKKNFILISGSDNVMNLVINLIENLQDNFKLKKIFILSNNIICNKAVVSNDLKFLVKEAIIYAKAHHCQILFSPGVESFEFFKNFEERGELFNQYVHLYCKE